MRSARLRTAFLGTVLATTSGCGFLNDLAQREARAVAAEPSVIPAGPATESPDADAPVVIAEGDLLLTGGGALGHLVVTQGPVRTGLVPPVPLFSEGCPVDGPSLQYVAVDFTYTTTNDHEAPQPGLAAHVRVDRVRARRPTSAMSGSSPTPAGIRGPTAPATRPCRPRTGSGTRWVPRRRPST